MASDKSRVVERWLSKAEHDLATARIMSAQPTAYHDVVCYHCEQAVEKSLKALLVVYDHDFPKTHSLPELLTLCTEHVGELLPLMPDMQVLTEYAVAPRYPLEETDEPDMAQATDALQRAEHAFSTIVGYVRRYSSP